MTSFYTLTLLLLVPAAEPAAPGAGPVSIEVGKETIEFGVATPGGRAVVTRYHIGPSVAKPFFWPVLSPEGIPLTRDWPMEMKQTNEAIDHPHQKSLWFCHGDVIPEGLALKQKIKGVEGVDFWSEGLGHGVIACIKVDTPEQKGHHGQVTTYNEWRTADGTKVLDEKRTIHLHDLGTARLLVLDIDLHASVAPLTFGDTKEGSLGARVRQVLRADDKGMGQLSNSEGKKGEKGPDGCWGQIAAWCDDSGPVDGKTAGLAIFADPGNPYPTCWHSRGYGLMAANPFGRDRAGFPAMQGNKNLVKVAKGEHLKLRYGILLHSGDVKEGKVAEHFKEFVALEKTK